MTSVLVVAPLEKETRNARRHEGSSLRRLVADVVLLCRPKHWTKNLFLLAPFLFAESSHTLAGARAALIGFGCFCLWSSAVYLANDVIDAEADRRHPRKCNRPVASGRVHPFWAGAIAAVLAGLAAVGACLTLPFGFLVLGVLYLGNSLAYCTVFKYRVIVDVIMIAIGFVIRLLAGCATVGVVPSSWLVICGFSLALVLGFGKRRSEITNLQEGADYRRVLQSYSAAKLDMLVGISCAICLMSYMLYSISPETVRLHQTQNLIYTVPFVAYGLFRFVFKAQEGKGDGPVDILSGDPVFLINGLLWGLAVLVVLLVK